MILKSIVLENIRSYSQPTTIDFQLGTTLLEGDVASGKSTILSAVEFALFGLGDLNGSFLLRNGTDGGSVTLEFEADEKTYRVRRSLVRKGENVRSGDSYIEDGGEKEKYAARELKERILQLLRFNEPPNPKAQSVIYRYAIFTPQEAMRDIIERDPETRLETLRKAYGIEQYSTAAQNTRSVSTEFRGRVRLLKERTRELEITRRSLGDLRRRVEDLKLELAECKKRESDLKRSLDAKNAEREELEERKNEIGRAQDRIPTLTRELRDKEEQRRNAIRESESSSRRRDALSKEVARLQSVQKPTSRSKRDLEEESGRLQGEITASRDQISKLSERISNLGKLETGVCPTCGQRYEADQVSDRKKHMEEELLRIRESVKRMDLGKRGLDDAMTRLSDFVTAQEKLRLVGESLAESEERAKSGDAAAKKLDGDIVDLNEQIREANKASEPVVKIERDISRVNDELRRLERERAEALRSLGGMETELEKLRMDDERYVVQIKEMEELERLQGSLEEDRMWLSDYFAPTVELIERQMFANRNRRFNEQFQHWFQVLVDDPDLRVRVTEDFSPVIEREGYEQDYRQLSGGERTSVALAYRLALNTTVQEAALGQEPNLLILDEPTDGFSKEQLGKFGDILDELRCPQVILVSHERELENLADQVYRVEKVNGESTVATAPLHQN